MAQYPCEICGARYSGKQNTLYPALLSGTLTIRERVRMCPSCCEAAMTLAVALQDVSELLSGTNGCGGCREEGAPLAMFVTAYVRGGDREDVYARLCASCATRMVGPTLYGPGEALRPLDTALLITNRY
jgi:hypothetical protein